MPKSVKPPARQNVVRGNVDGILIQDSSGNITITQNVQAGSSDVDALFAALRAYLAERQPAPGQPANEEVEAVVATLESEAAKGEQADEGKLERWIRFLAGMAPDILDVIMASLGNPVSGIGMALKKIAERSRAPAA